MIPVEEGKTSSKMQWNSSAAATQVWRQASMPASPVMQLALPELTRIAETRPPVAARCLSANDDRGSHNAVTCEHRCGVGSAGGKGDSEIKLAADLDASFNCSPLEAERKICGRERCVGTHRNYFIKRDVDGMRNEKRYSVWRKRFLEPAQPHGPKVSTGDGIDAAERFAYRSA